MKQVCKENSSISLCNSHKILMEISSATDQIYGRFLKMCKVMEYAKNNQVRFLTKLSISPPRSIIGSNLRTVKKRLHMNNLATLMDEG